MADILLLGAGFTRNWGGLLADEVFEHLLACQNIQGDAYLRGLLWKYSDKGGFEYALEEVQSDHSRQPEEVGPKLQALQDRISRIYDSMNEAFFQRVTIETSNSRDRQLKTFFVRFDAIFTLNQDILLEHHYLPHVELVGAERWTGAQIPGMKRIRRQGSEQEAWGRDIWVPRDEEDMHVSERQQPLFKLHGSSNWRDTEGGRLLVVGGNKTKSIGSQAVLVWNAQQFTRLVSEGSSRLLVIGYSFRDHHINQEIIGAVRNHGLRFFVIDPLGSDVVRHANPSYEGTVYGRNALDEAFEVGLVGASRRSLADTFGDDAVSFENVTGFIG